MTNGSTSRDRSLHDTGSALRELAGLRLADTSTETMLRRVVELAVHAIPGASDASITLVGPEGLSTPVATGAAASTLDAVQYAHGNGPCLDASDAGEVCLLADVDGDTQWPWFVDDLKALGIRSVMATPLPLHADLSGALNVYATRARTFGPAESDTARSLAAYAGAALSNVHQYEATQRAAAASGAAIAARAVVEQAKGILISRHRCTAGAAFDLMVGEAQRTGARVHIVAERLVASVAGAS